MYVHFKIGHVYHSWPVTDFEIVNRQVVGFTDLKWKIKISFQMLNKSSPPLESIGGDHLLCH
jgi:hypothetical protein